MSDTTLAMGLPVTGILLFSMVEAGQKSLGGLGVIVIDKMSNNNFDIKF
jgi:hypothetical protein